MKYGLDRLSSTHGYPELIFLSMWNNVINAWWPLVFYPATDAPWFTKGMWAMIGTALATLGATALVWWLERREKRGLLRTGGQEEEQDAGQEKVENEERARKSYEKGEKDGYTGEL